MRPVLANCWAEFGPELGKIAGLDSMDSVAEWGMVGEADQHSEDCVGYIGWVGIVLDFVGYIGVDRIASADYIEEPVPVVVQALVG